MISGLMIAAAIIPVAYDNLSVLRHIPCRQLDDVEYATLEWVDWFNHRRLLTSIGNLPPAELELMYDRQHEESATAA